jgi:hypothetical protein
LRRYQANNENKEVAYQQQNQVHHLKHVLNPRLRKEAGL